jgi:tetratricopeptide (TPR) repeat protein
MLRKLLFLGAVTMAIVITIVALYFGVGVGKTLLGGFRTVWVISLAAIICLAVAFSSRISDKISCLSGQLFRLVKFVGLCALLIALIGFLVRLSTNEGITILAFDDQTKEGKYNGKAIADSLQLELSQIQNTLAAHRENIESSERLMPMHFQQENERLNENVKDIGTIGTGEAKISLGALLVACKSVWPIGGPRTLITGCVQRFGDSMRIVAKVESNKDVHSYELTGLVKTDDDLLNMIRQLSFKVAKSLEDPQHPISAKTPEGLHKYTDALECFDRFTISGDKTDLDCARDHCLKAFDCESDYKKLFNLLTDVGIEYAEAKDYRSAAEVFEKAVLLDPKNATAYNNLGLMFGRLQRIEEAREAFKKAKLLSKEPGDVVEETYYTNLGDAQFYASHFDEAERSYEAVLVKHDSIAALLGVAQVCVAREDYDRARKYLDKVSTLDPQAIKPHLLLGEMFETKGDWESARGEYEKAVAIDPQNAEAFDGLGNIALELGDAETAVPYFQQSIDSADNYSSPHVGLGAALSARGDIAGAIQEYKRAWALDPLDDGPHNALGELLSQRRQFNEAELEFRKGIALAPESPTGYIDLGDLFLAQAKYEDARKEYDAAEKISPKSRQLLYSLGDWYLAKQDYDNAETKYRDAVNIAPSYPLSHAKLGNLYRASGKLNLAAEEYQHAIDLAPTLAEGHNGLGDTSYDRGDYLTAFKEYSLAAQLSAGWPEPHVGLGNVYYATGDFEKAGSEYRYAIDRQPFISDAHAYLGDTYRQNGNYDKSIEEYSVAIKNDAHDAYSHAQFAAILFATGKNQEAQTHCETAYRVAPREYRNGFIMGVNSLIRNQPKQAEEVWNKVLSVGFRRNDIDEEIDRFLLLCALNKNEDARHLLSDEILTLPIPPVGLLLQANEWVNSLPLKRSERFSFCRSLLANARNQVAAAATEHGSGKSGDTLKTTNLPAKALGR